MDKDVTDSTEFYQLAEWFNKNRTRVISIVATVVIVIALAGIFFWHKSYNENQASLALSNLRSPLDSQIGTPATAESYLKIAQDYPGTQAAARALLIAGGIQFDAGKFDQAQQSFALFMQNYNEDPFVNQAMIGIAASLEAQGKTNDAAARYEDLVKKHATESTAPQAKSALARLYVAQGKPEQAMRIYEELAHVGNNDSWTMEAGIELQELLAKYPNLKKTAPSLPASPAAATPGKTNSPSPVSAKK